MKKNLKIWLLCIGIIMIVTPLTIYSLKFYLQARAKNLYSEAEKYYNKKYAYLIHDDKLDQVLYGKDSLEASKIKQYYIELADSLYAKKSKLIVKPTIPVDLHYISVSKPIYFPPTEKSGSILKGYVFNAKCWGYYEVFLPRALIKDTPPPDKLLDKFRNKISGLPKNKNKSFKSRSPYGFYCE